MILKNGLCNNNKNNNIECTYNREFQPQNIETSVLSATNATLVAFFDILENVNFEDLLD
jgi:hypothetical protein